MHRVLPYILSQKRPNMLHLRLRLQEFLYFLSKNGISGNIFCTQSVNKTPCEKHFLKIQKMLFRTSFDQNEILRKWPGGTRGTLGTKAKYIGFEFQNRLYHLKDKKNIFPTSFHQTLLKKTLVVCKIISLIFVTI